MSIKILCADTGDPEAGYERSPVWMGKAEGAMVAELCDQHHETNELMPQIHDRMPVILRERDRE